MLMARTLVETNYTLAAITRDCSKMFRLFLLSPKVSLRCDFRGPLSPVQVRFSINKMRGEVSPLILLVLMAGLEPARYCYRGILSPLRLPISPHQQMQHLF